MKKEILIIGIIFLFIGVGVQPAFAVEISNDITTEDNEDCNCKEVDNYKLENFNIQIGKLETFSKLLLLLSNNNPEIKVQYQELLDDINLFEEIYDDLENNIPLGGRPICNILKDLFWKTLDKYSYYANLGVHIYLEENNWVLASIFISISFIYFSMHIFIDIIYLYLLCDSFPLN
jgi:hypothetical protein